MHSSDTLTGLTVGSRSALFSECGSYRYLLTRSFESGVGSCLFVMLNPSTADADSDDPTVRRCSSFVRSWGYRELRIVNLFALRSVDPRNLESVADPIGPKNDAVLRQELQSGGLLVAAWGNRGALRRRSSAVLEMIFELKVSAMCLGVNGTGEPVHPLYVSAAARPLIL